MVSIICGGGISGLYTAYKLLKNTDNKVLVFEKDNRLGGRIKTTTFTHKKMDFTIEEGAGRLNTNHKMFISLIEELGLLDKLIKITGDVTFEPNKNSRLYNNLDDKTRQNTPFKLINKVIRIARKAKVKDPYNVLFRDFAKEHLTPFEYKLLFDSSGYYGEIYFGNLEDSMKLFTKGIRGDIDYFVVNGGLGVIIETLADRIRELGGIIYKKHTLVDFGLVSSTQNKYQIEVEHNGSVKIFQCNHIVLALPKPALIQIPQLKSRRRLLNSIHCKSLMRVYSVFPRESDGTYWFENYGKTTTNNNNRYMIPIDKERGLIMTSYTDSKYADYWYTLEKRELINQVMENVEKTIGKRVRRPTKTIVTYWDCGVGFWKKGVDSKHLSNDIIKPFGTDIPIFICGENYSQTQGWIEGALETSEIAIQTIIKTSN